MRRLVGALVLFLSIIAFKAGDVFIPWRLVSGTLDSPTDAPSPAVPKPSGRRTQSPPDVPSRYRREPLVFLFTASVDSLVLLPGIGPVLAERIVHARTDKRSFSQWDDLLDVKGIGPVKLDRLKRLTDATN